MKFDVSKTSCMDPIAEMEFNNLDELLEFAAQNKHPLIITKPMLPNFPKWNIEIYDDWRE